MNSCKIWSSTKRNAFIRVPPELLDAVLSHFTDGASLATFSQVCRAWKHSCYRTLFKTVRFKAGHDSDRTYTGPSARVLVSKGPSGGLALAPQFIDLLAFFDAAPDVCPHVKELYLVGTCTPGTILSSSQSGLRLDLLQMILMKLPALQVLSLHFLHLLPTVTRSPVCSPIFPHFWSIIAEPPIAVEMPRTKLKRLHIGYLDSPPNEADGVVHVLDVLDLFDDIKELDLDCMLIPERALKFALPENKALLPIRSQFLRVTSLVFGEHCSPTLISLLVNVLLTILPPDTLASIDVQLARNSSRFISDILPDVNMFLKNVMHNLRSFTCDISGGRYLKPDAEISVNDQLVRSALACCSRLEVITLFLVIRADGASHAACKRSWNSCMNLLWSASGSSRALARVNIAFLACDCDGDYCQEKSAFLENIGLLDWSRVDTFVERCSSSLKCVTIKAMDGPYRQKGSFSDRDQGVGELGMKVHGVVQSKVSLRTQAVLRFR